MKNIPGNICTQNQNTHFMFFFFHIMPFLRYVENFGKAEQATDKNMAHTHCMLDTYGYKHTPRIYNTY
jgi:hypothetical protein